MLCLPLCPPVYPPSPQKKLKVKKRKSREERRRRKKHMSRPPSQPAPPGASGSIPGTGPSSTGRNYPQDYIVRIRYQNTLPPPPNPPKLLDIPNPAVAQYTSTGFASRLAREQPLNVEVDSELGMPLDLIHVPGVFERDESGEHTLGYIRVIFWVS